MAEAASRADLVSYRGAYGNECRALSPRLPTSGLQRGRPDPGTVPVLAADEFCAHFRSGAPLGETGAMAHDDAEVMKMVDLFA